MNSESVETKTCRFYYCEIPARYNNNDIRKYNRGQCAFFIYTTYMYTYIYMYSFFYIFFIFIFFSMKRSSFSASRLELDRNIRRNIIKQRKNVRFAGITKKSFFFFCFFFFTIKGEGGQRACRKETQKNILLTSKKTWLFTCSIVLRGFRC